MKKAMSVIMVLVLAIAFTACSSNTESQTETTSQNTTTSQPSTDAAADNTAEGGRTLVVYYSATGNTQRVAEYIAAATGGDLLAEAAGTGNWLEGERFRSSASESDVTDWVNGLGL